MPVVARTAMIVDSGWMHAYSSGVRADAAEGPVPKYPNSSFRSIAVTLSLAGMLAGGTAFLAAPAAAGTVTAHHAAHRSPKHPARHRARHLRPNRHVRPNRHAHHRRLAHKRNAHHTRHAHLKGHAHLKRHGRARKALTPRQLARQGRWQLLIPGIGVTSRLLSLGDPHGPVLSVPALSQAAEAAWYNFSAVPGTPGNAVVVGHVDTYTGPAVFYDLYELRHGDLVYISMGGRRARFAVDRVTEVRKGRFPVNRIFGATASRRLWIITCGGAFDYATRHYMDNIIVSASYQPVRRNQRH